MINSGVQNERHSNISYITFIVRMCRKQTCISEVMIISALMCIASVTKDKNKLPESPVRSGKQCNLSK